MFVVASYAFAKMIPIRIEKTKKTMHSWRRMQSFNLEVIAYMHIMSSGPATIGGSFRQKPTLLY